MRGDGCLVLFAIAATAVFLWGAAQPRASERDQICAAYEAYC